MDVLVNLKNKIMLRFLITILIFSLLTTNTFGQTSSKQKVNANSGSTWTKNSEKKPKGNISGRILNASNNQPLSYANVSLSNTKSNKIIEGTITSNNGKFSIKDIETGSYKLIISFLGFSTKEIEFNLTKNNLDYKFKKIKLESSSKNINEVKINETKAIYENKIDKIVYNPENDINQSADNASDVLRKAPLLSVDLDGNVSLRGSNNIKFLVNGKASSFLTNDVSTALKMIPADQVKSIEVITSPGAKYDGEGDAGIVNIITKKKIIDGYKGTLSGSLGDRVSRTNLNLTIGKGKFGISARGGIFGMYWPRKGKSEYERIDWNDTDTNILLRNGTTFSRWTGYRSGIDMYFDINRYSSFNSSFSFGGRDKFSDDTTKVNFTGDTNYSYESIINTSSTSNEIEWNTDYTKKFKNNENRELSISFQYSSELDDEKSTYTANQSITRNYSDAINNEMTFQLDYSHPFGKKSKIGVSNHNSSSQNKRGKGRKGSKESKSDDNKIELGIKYIDRNNQFDYYTNSDSNGIITELISPDVFNYTQSVASAYLSTQFILPKNFGIVIGGRYELTNISGKYKNSPNLSFEREPYTNFLPNIVINKKISMTKSLKLSYSNRIRRPGSYYINPNIGILDDKNIIEGNPNLKPALSKQLEFGYNSFSRVFQSSYYIYLKNTYDVIESNISINEENVSVTNFRNIGSNKKIGFNYYGSITLNSVNLRGGFNIFQYSSDDERYGSIKTILYNYNFGGTVKLKKGVKIETWGWFSSPQQTIQGATDSWSMMSFGIKRDFKNKRGSLGLRIVEPFNKYKNMRSEIIGENFTQNTNRQIAMRSYGISFSYTFGKLNFKEKRVTNKIKNNDIQDGGNQQQ
ncbi:MAG: hypothetical protein CMP51_00130 [Flavobacteriales bacterium]|nr:hypothetical protein [Flavobacteriales bacterium]